MGRNGLTLSGASLGVVGRGMGLEDGLTLTSTVGPWKGWFNPI